MLRKIGSRATMIQASESFSTAMVPRADRVDAWLYRAKQICGDCRYQFPRRPVFQGCIERRTVAGVELTRFSSTPVSFSKTPVVSASSPERNCIITTQLEGVGYYCQQGALTFLNPGDATLLDSGQPWSSDCAGLCSRLYVRVPMWWMRNRLRLAKLPVLPRISGACGMGATLFRLLTSLFQDGETFTLEEGAATMDAYLGMLSACLRGSDPGRSGELCPGRFGDRIEKFIEAHLADPALGPAALAEAAGISVRHLHRLFSARGRRVSEWIRERRLERCCADLVDRRASGRSITEIAFCWGFSDSAHFSRSFKRHFGVSPREFCSQVESSSWQRGRSLLLGPGARLFPLN